VEGGFLELGSGSVVWGTGWKLVSKAAQKVSLTVVLSVFFSFLMGAAVSSVRMPFAPPDPSSGASGSFSFLVYGDIQDNYRDGHRDLVEQMLAEPSASLVFNTGDISPDDGKHYDRDFFPIIRDLAVTTPFFPGLGNHDIQWKQSGGRLGFRSFFQATFRFLAQYSDNSHLRPPDGEKLWYTLVHKGVQFIVLDSNLFIDEGKYRKTHELPSYDGFLEDQLSWLQAILEKHYGDSDIRARFIFFHHSPFISHETTRPFNLGGHPGHSRMLISQEIPSGNGNRIKYLLDLFRYYRVTAVFTGHEHYYERWRESIFANGKIRNQINWIVTGMGGVKPRGKALYRSGEIADFLEDQDFYQDYLNRVSEIDPEWTSELRHLHPDEEDSSSRFHNYIRVDVDPEGIYFQTKDVSGEIRDSGRLQ
jgi:hypothetical protein